VDQNEDVKKALLETGKKYLVENTKDDYYWGCGSDGNGKNQLGKTLMIVREQVRNQVEKGSIPLKRAFSAENPLPKISDWKFIGLKTKERLNNKGKYYVFYLYIYRDYEINSQDNIFNDYRYK